MRHPGTAARADKSRRRATSPRHVRETCSSGLSRRCDTRGVRRHWRWADRAGRAVRRTLVRAGSGTRGGPITYCGGNLQAIRLGGAEAAVPRRHLRGPRDVDQHLRTRCGLRRGSHWLQGREGRGRVAHLRTEDLVLGRPVRQRHPGGGPDIARCQAARRPHHAGSARRCRWPADPSDLDDGRIRGQRSVPHRRLRTGIVASGVEAARGNS